MTRSEDGKTSSDLAVRRFQGGTAVVTGGGAGIGEGFVRYLAAIGMHVVVADVHDGRANALVDELIGSGCQASAQHVDVTKASEVEDLAVKTFDRFGSVELLVNNAGLETGGLLWEVSLERWKYVMSVNVDGMYYGIRSFVPKMIEKGKPAVIANIASTAAVSVGPLEAPYTISKHAVLSMTECLHQELAFVEAPIQVSVVLPYSVRSQIFLDARNEGVTSSDATQLLLSLQQTANVEYGLDPVLAAEHMMEGIAAGRFWIFSDDEMGNAAVQRRIDLLTNLSPPPDPWPKLIERGFTRS